MKNFLKKHIGLVVLLVMIFAFPASMSTQARLNMRIIITGLAIDKVDDGYEVTAQIVKTTPGTESSGTGATINFISDTGNTLISAISKLSYKSGKVAGFSHTNFILLGKKMLENDLTKDLNYFIKDNIIKDSVLVLIADGSAKEEIMKTKDVELSVGLGLQKVFMYKEKESDGTMTTLLTFMNNSNNFSKTAVASVLSLNPNSNSNEKSLTAETETKTSLSDISGSPTESQNSSSDTSGGSLSSGGSSSSSESEGGSSGGSGESSSSSDEGSSGSEGGGSSSSESGSQGGGSEYQYFDALTPLVCFVSGKFAGVFEKEEEIMGYMFSQKKSISQNIGIENVTYGQFKNSKIGVDIKHKNNKFKIRYEQNTPCLDIYVNIKNSEIKEIQNEEQVFKMTKDEFEYIKTEISKFISERVSKTFEKARGFGADVFGAYDMANKQFYQKTNNTFSSMEEFLNKLKLNVIVNIARLEY